MVVGDRFTMKPDAQPEELRNPKNGSILIRALPGQSYRVTGKTLEWANTLVAQGKAVAGYMGVPSNG